MCPLSPLFIMFTATTHVAPKITVNPCGRLEITYADGMELETRTEVCNPSLSLSPSSSSLLVSSSTSTSSIPLVQGPSTACGTMRSDPLESPYDHDFPIVGHEDFFGPHANWQQDAEAQPTRATAKVAAAFVVRTQHRPVCSLTTN